MAEWTYGGRLNSLQTYPHLFAANRGSGKLGTLQLLERLSLVAGIRGVDFNYPEHFATTDPVELRQALVRLGLSCNGVAMRFDDRFARGDFAHPERSVRREAIEITHAGARICERMGGEVLTLWFAHDGYDYPFEGDHRARYERSLAGIHEIAEAYPHLKIAIEYKPYQPRAFTALADIGMVLLAIRDIGAANVGVTLDYCHMLMKRENPSQSLAMAAQEGRLFGVHLNDGYGDNDDGMIAGSANLVGLLEFVYYLKEYRYTGLIYFDTFPDRIDPVQELGANVATIRAASDWIDAVGRDTIRYAVGEHSPLGTHRLILKLLAGR